MEAPDIPGAIRPDAIAATRKRATNRALLIGGIGIFIVGVALLVFAIAMFAGATH